MSFLRPPVLHSLVGHFQSKVFTSETSHFWTFQVGRFRLVGTWEMFFLWSLLMNKMKDMYIYIIAFLHTYVCIYIYLYKQSWICTLGQFECPVWLVWLVCVCVFFVGTNKKRRADAVYQTNNIYLDLPKGAEWMIRGAYTPSLRVQTAPFGRCWYLNVTWTYSILEFDPYLSYLVLMISFMGT